MCTYNRERYIRRAIESVLNQTYDDLEFIIVDDGSKDNTKDIIESYQDKRIKYYPLERNSFYCYAANYGLQFCQGEYIAFMNSDDIWLPEKLEKQLRYLQEHQECKACFTALTLIDNEENDISDTCHEMRDLFSKQYASQKECIQYLFKYKNTLCHPSALVPKSVMDQVGGFNLMFCQLADYDLWLRIVSEGPIHVLEERLIQFRWDLKKKSQISIATKETVVRTFNEQVLIRKYFIERLPDEKFIEFFGEQFKNKESKSHVELEFERAFLLAECMSEAPELKVLGIEKIEQAMRYPEAMKILREHFGMDIFELYGWNKAHMYKSPWLTQEMTDLQLTINHLNNLMVQQKYNYDEMQSQLQAKEQKIVELECQVQQKEQLIGTYENSTSWKMTKPFREFMRMLKKIRK